MEGEKKKVVLHGYWRSGCSWRLRTVLNYKGIDFEYKAVHLVKDGGEQHSEAYKKLNPAEMVPCLEIDGQILTESMAICEYLEEVHGDDGKKLLPSDPVQRF